jgi:hypothetical protein
LAVLISREISIGTTAIMIETVIAAIAEAALEVLAVPAAEPNRSRLLSKSAGSLWKISWRAGVRE